MKKRLLAGLIGLCVAFSVMPAVAFATGDTVEAKWGASKDNLTSSGTLATALQEASVSGSAVKYIQLQSDVSFAQKITADDSDSYTIDLNGKTFSARFSFYVAGNANITFVDTAETDGTFLSNGTSAIDVSGKAQVCIEGGSYAGKQIAVKTTSGSPSVTIAGGSFSAGDGNQTLAVDHSCGTLTIENGTFSAGSVSGVQVAASGSLTINGGNFEGSTDYGNVTYRGGKLELGATAPWSQIELYSNAKVILGSNKISLPSEDYLAVDANGGVHELKTGSELAEGKYRVGHKDASYTIIFKNGDATLQSSEVKIGVVPVYLGDTPTKAADAQYTYVFNDWGKELVAASCDTTYTATYNSTVNKYTVEFVNEDHTVLQTSAVEYGTVPAYTGETPTKAADAQYTYTFKGWDKELAAVTGEATYTATYSSTVNEYVVKFVDEDGTTVLDEQTVEYGGSATAPADPAKAGWSFNGWDKAFDNITGDLTVKATYKINQYTVTFDSKGGTPVEAITQDYGTVVTAPTNPTKPGHNFMGWSPAVPSAMPAENVTVTAQWAEYSIVEINGEAVDGNSGKGGVWTVGSAEGLTVRCSGDFALFKDLYIDGALVDKAHYDAREGSTVVTLKPEYLQGLSVDQHKLEFHYSDGAKVPVTLEIMAAPSDEGDKSSGNDKSDDVIAKTGDNASWPVVVLGVILAGAVAVFARRRIA